MGFNNLGADALAATPGGRPPEAARRLRRRREHRPQSRTPPTRRRPITSPSTVPSRRWPTTWPSTSGRRTRRACADLQEPSRAARPARCAGGQDAGSGRSSSSWHPTWKRRDFDALVSALATVAGGRPDPVQHDACSTSGEAGGLSGRPLLARMLAAVSRARELAGDRLVIIASGGISSGDGRGRGSRRRRRPRAAVDRAGLPRAGADRSGDRSVDVADLRIRDRASASQRSEDPTGRDADG